MKLTPLGLGLVLAFTALPAFAEGPLAPGAKAPAPAMSKKMKSVDGKTVSLAEGKGAKGTLVVFTCNHCPWAKKWEKRIAELGNTYAAQGIGAVAVNSNDPKASEEDKFEAMQDRAKSLSLKFPYVVDDDSSVAKAFGATKTPEAFLIDASGTIVYHGAVDDNADDAAQVKEHYLKSALESLSKGSKISKAETKAIGCSIKFRS